MRRWIVVAFAIMVLAASASAHAGQVTETVSVLNPYEPRYVTLLAETDRVIVRQGFGGVDCQDYKNIRELIRDTGVFFVLDARDATGAELRVVGPKLVLEYQSDTSTWKLGWEYRIHVKHLPSGVYSLRGIWTNTIGTVFEFEPTYMTVP